MDCAEWPEVHLWRGVFFFLFLLKKQQHLASSTTSTSACAVIGAFEWAASGSSAFSSPLVELTTCARKE